MPLPKAKLGIITEKDPDESHEDFMRRLLQRRREITEATQDQLKESQPVFHRPNAPLPDARKDTVTHQQSPTTTRAITPTSEDEESAEF